MATQPDLSNLASRTATAVTIMVAIALIHAFRLGTHLDGKLFTLYYSYVSDIVIPFGMYFTDNTS